MASFFDTFPRPTKTYHSQTYPYLAAKNTFTGTGKTVLITAGATGIGYSISKAFCTTNITRLIILSRSPGPQERARTELATLHPNVKVETHQVSITDYSAITSLLATAGPIDVLVLSAAETHGHDQNTTVLPLSDVQSCFETNVMSTYHLAQTYLTSPALPSGEKKIILNVSSVSAHAILPNQAGYGPSKAAAAQLLQHFAADFREQARIISFHPGALYTEAAAKQVSKDAFEWEDLALPGDFAVWAAGREAGFLNGRFLWAGWDVEELKALEGRVGGEGGFLTVGLVL